MSWEAIKLHLCTPLHLGRGLDELDNSGVIYHSDSLKSALFSLGLADFPHWANDNADAFFSGFHISSCFPFAGQEYFLPKPFLNVRFKFNGVPEDRQAKTGKKVSFLSIPVFSQFVGIDDGGELIIDQEHITPDGEFICANIKTAGKSFYKSELQQRVSVPLEGVEDQPRPFYLDRVYFEENCGLYFLADFKGNVQLRNEIFQTLKLLGEQGIGTDRTVGNGLFNFDETKDVQTVDLRSTSKHKVWMSLGLYLPGKEEFGYLNLEKSSWVLLKRGGYMGGTSNERFLSLRKKSIFFFGEGSVFNSRVAITGKKVDLKPEWKEPIHPVWRDGQCLFLAI